jgi:phospholipid/cholesterol/gamma-HCH transport system substrate-binding protein
MRRIVFIALALLVAGLFVALPATGDDDAIPGDYLVRAYFDNGAFVAPGEDVRVAGATVGSVDSIAVSTGDEVTSENGDQLPAKAVVVLKIKDDGFQDFREDASCRIRPQSLLGEKYIDCVPTQPRAPGSEPPPELQLIEDGPGEGERLLPVERNGTSVDLDLVQNINRLSYRERFRLILNELGAGVAGRGEDLGEVIDRANPALQQTDRVLKILADQNQALASLASNGDTVLEPLAREREHITGFMANAQVAAAATAERKAELEAQLQKLPRFLGELRLTMKDLRGVTDTASPVLADLGVAAPDLTRATRNLGPLSRVATPALRSLGRAAQKAGPKLVQSDDLTVDLIRAASRAAPASKNLKKLFGTFEQTNGIKSLLDFIRFSTASINGFDSFGHFLRTNVLVTSCIEIQPDQSAQNCIAQWGKGPTVGTASAAAASRADADLRARTPEQAEEPADVTPEAIPELLPSEPQPEQPEEPAKEPPPTGEEPLGSEPEQSGSEPSSEVSAERRMRPLGTPTSSPLTPTSSPLTPIDLDSTNALLLYLLGP